MQNPMMENVDNVITGYVVQVNDWHTFGPFPTKADAADFAGALLRAKGYDRVRVTTCKDVKITTRKETTDGTS